MPGGQARAEAHFWFFFGVAGVAPGGLLGRSWGGLGTSSLVGPLPSPPGPLLGVILASGRSLFRAFWEVFWEAGPVRKNA